jgi:hypothetical protein
MVRRLDLVFISAKPFSRSGFSTGKIIFTSGRIMNKAVPLILSLLPLAAVIGACVACP